MSKVGDDLNATAAWLIRKERASKALTQEALADLCGLDRTYISAIERGERNISIDALGRILEALGLDSVAFARAIER